MIGGGEWFHFVFYCLPFTTYWENHFASMDPLREFDNWSTQNKTFNSNINALINK